MTIQKRIGFEGERREVVAEAEEAGHVLRVVRYVFPCGGKALYVEASESHDGNAGGALLPLSDVVHLVQNITDRERWEITMREIAADAAKMDEVLADGW